ncbi:MAG: hypothetical protein AAGF11_24465 [Myxococcota bacterium]
MIVQNQDFTAREIRIKTEHVEGYDANELVTHDLHIGDQYYDPGSQLPRPFPGRKDYVLRPGRCVVVETAEELVVPNNIFGLLCSKGSLSAQGLLVANTKVDPLFKGNLRVAVYNASNTPVKMAKGKPFCAIAFHLLERSVHAAEARKPPDIRSQPRGSLERFWDWISAQAPIFSILATVVAVANLFLTHSCGS